MKVSFAVALCFWLPLNGRPADLNSIDPPPLAGRVSYTSGDVSFIKTDDPKLGSSPVSLNRIVTVGDTLWAGPDGRTELDLGSSFLRLNSETVASVRLLDGSNLKIEFGRGDLNVRVRNVQDTDTVEVDLPFGDTSLRLMQSGGYRVHVSPGDSATISVREGRVEVTGTGNPFFVESHQRLRIRGATLTHVLEQENQEDDFDQFCESRDQSLAIRGSAPAPSLQGDGPTPVISPSPGMSSPADGVRDAANAPPATNAQDQQPVQPGNQVTSGPQLPTELVGGVEVNNTNGLWYNDSKVGPVWSPRDVDPNWAPYRFGQWNWVDPWGWTWVDDASWGFATSHYGRWAYLHDRWAWVPGPALSSKPVYAPALVAFVGSSPDKPELMAGNTIPAVAWFPLGPGDAYIPPYESTMRYWTSVNVTNTKVLREADISNLYTATRGGTYMDEHLKQPYTNRKVLYATTAVSQENFLSARSLGHARIALNPKELHSAKVIGMAAQLSPSSLSVMPQNGGRLASPPANVLTTQRWMLNRSGFQSVPFSAQQESLAGRRGRPLEHTQLQSLNQRLTAERRQGYQPRVQTDPVPVVNTPLTPSGRLSNSTRPNSTYTDQRRQSIGQQPYRGNQIQPADRRAPSTRNVYSGYSPAVPRTAQPGAASGSINESRLPVSQPRGAAQSVNVSPQGGRQTAPASRATPIQRAKPTPAPANKSAPVNNKKN